MDLTVSQMLAMQQELYELHKNQWHPTEPEYGKDFILYMMEEIGETISILKKKGSSSVMTDASVRAAFLEEMSDVLMYYHDILLRFRITADELSDAYCQKHAKNMGRNYTQEYKELYYNGEG